MTNKELFKEAILDAKSVREAALANAKKTLEETLTPQLQSMLTKKLQEMEGDDDEVNEVATPETSLDEELDLDEILKELESDNSNSVVNETEEVDEAKKDETKKEPKKDDTESKESESEESTEIEPAGEHSEAEEITDDAKLNTLTVADLKDLLQAAIAQAMPASDALGGEHDMDNLDGGEDDLGGEDELGGDPAQLDAPSEFGAEAPEFGSNGGDHHHHDDDEVNLDELLAELEQMDKTNEVKKPTKEEVTEDKKDLAEAIKTIKILRKELNEVNLLNAKLLYVNKIFKAKNLTESQKAKIIFTFDKANSAKEAKLIYETLLNSVEKTNKKPITEARGFASKPAGVAKRVEPIVNNEMERWQFLAGIKKNKY